MSDNRTQTRQRREEAAARIDTPHFNSGRKMPSFAGKLTDTEMARVLTFVRNTWGNDAAPVTTHEVARIRQETGK
ncbi:hypothetical protein BN2476_470009 [Paraburkholderia piptadeniae]|uniref:Uncharacterized protein n=1 Tax=Paraburkholderia piptadeniae TaxID=1701573 RepID=A0A1N7SDT3_9BURK|nr:hypothetical protein BN2476_470009 [Paraburkholderia piptadeniae]